MKIFRRSAIYVAMFFLLVGIAAPSAMLAQEEPDWTIYFHPGIRFGTDDRVIGFYDVLVPVYLTDTSMLFVNPRFSHDSTHGHEWNLGGGYRQILWDNQLMLGLNAYYDLKKDGRSGYWFDQWGMGFEAMGEFDHVIASGGGLGLTGRFNFYVPLSGSKTEGGVGVGGGGYTFKNLGIYGGGGGVVYEPLTGVDYEMGMRIPYLSKYVETWAYAGGYHYWGKESGNMDGFCGRIEVIPTDFVALDFEYRNDNWYGDEFYGEVKVEVPFSIGNLVEGKNPFEGLGSRFGGSRDLAERMSEPVRRDIDIKIETVETGDPTNATGGLIEEVIFVSEGGEADPLADGTFEHPYGTIGDAMGDPRIGVTAFTIHVINDDGGDGVVYTGAVTVNMPNLTLWGSGVPHPMYGAVCGMCSGYPDIASSLDISGDNMEVYGLLLSSGMEVSGGTGSSVHDNLFNNTLTVSGGTGLSVYDNRFEGPGSGYGLNVNGPTDSLSVSSNLFQDWDYGMYIDGGTNLSFSRNTLTDCEAGIRLYDGDGSLITNNTITNCTSGIVSSNVNDLTITYNNISSIDYGISLWMSGGNDLVTSITNNIINVDSTGDSSDAVGIYLADMGEDIYATITDNELVITDEDNDGDVTGIDIWCSSGGIAYPTIRDNTIALWAEDGDTSTSWNESYGIEIEAGGIGGPGAGEALAIMGNTITMLIDGPFDGIHLWTDSGGSLYASGAGGGIRNNTITGNADETTDWVRGIYFYSDADAFVDITGNSVDVQDLIASGTNGVCGISMYARNILYGSISDNPLIRAASSSGAYGILAVGYLDIGTPTNPFTISNNSDISVIGGNSGRMYGIFCDTWNGDTFAQIIGNSDINLTGTGAGGYGIRIETDFGLIGDSSDSSPTPYTLISGNTCTIDTTGLRYGVSLDTATPNSTNWVSFGAGTPGSIGTNTFTAIGGGWHGFYAGGVVWHNFTIPTDRIDP